MTRTCFNGQDERHTILEAKESVLRYALAHQQLEVVVQLAYTLGFYEGHIRVNVNGDNVRINVVKLGTARKGYSEDINKNEDEDWRFDQDSEGNTAIIDAILCDNTTGNKVATWKPSSNGDGGLKNALQRRYSGGGRAFNKSGSLVFAGDEFREGFGWRLSKEMEGSVLKWRLGGKIWLSYWPNDVKSPYFETRCVDWCEEVDLPLIRVN
ncbi:hypothetical protein GIB67_025942 [Kingdonia uniflora]|uniref:Uncharacterized protein n=1 Tax=Kingdonia uniflora TaxID=39325 RepID=A0A7J7PC70_9MAGN|nr:hypothetical protein GIB67_025942 [Kingdonia uniflora]